MRISSLALAGLLALAFAQPAHSQERGTNSELLGRALRQAVDSLFQRIKVSPGARVVILPAPGQESVWGLENEIAAGLRTRGAGKVTFHGAVADTAAPQAAPKDTSIHEPLHPGVPIDVRPLDPTAELIEYRVAALAVTYTGTHKSRVLGATQVDRLAKASLAARHMSPEGGLMEAASGSASLQDRVAEEDLPQMEDNLYQFPRPVVPTRDLTRVLEPAIVVGLVTGLVFLFYTNRN